MLQKMTNLSLYRILLYHYWMGLSGLVEPITLDDASKILSGEYWNRRPCQSLNQAHFERLHHRSLPGVGL